MSEVITPNPIKEEPWGLQERQFTPEQVELLKPGKAALVVIDAQKAYADPNEVLAKDIVKSTTHDLDEMAKKLPGFIDTARKAGIRVIWTRMIEDPSKMSQNYALKMKIEDTPPVSTPGTRGFEYIGEGLPDDDPRSQLKPVEGEKEVVKKDYSAFQDTDLAEHLNKSGISTVVLAGAYASRCVLFTSVGAVGNKFHLFVARDMVADLDADNFEVKPVLNLLGTVGGYVPYSRQITEVWKPISNK
jgi:nicotinamidase-related amidase